MNSWYDLFVRLFDYAVVIVCLILLFGFLL